MVEIGILRTDGQRFAERGERVVQPARLLLCFGEPGPCAHMEGIATDRGPENFLGGIEMADLAQCGTEVFARCSVIGLCGNRLAELIGSSNGATGVAQHGARVGEKIGVPRFSTQRLVDQDQSFGAASGLVQQEPEEMRRSRMISLGSKNLPIKAFRFLQPPRLVQLQSLGNSPINIAPAWRLPGATCSALCAFAPSQCPVDGTPAMFV